MEIRREKHSNRRESETKRAKREPLFLAQIVGNGSRCDTSGDTSDQRATCGPAYAYCIQVKELAQKSDCAADHNVVVAK
jgi:hypothetical protein